MPEGGPEGPPGRQIYVGESTYEAEAPPGKSVTVTYQDIRLTARKVKYDREKKTVVAEGDAVLEQGASKLRGERIDFDLAEKVGVVTDAKLDLEGGVHLRSALLAKVGPRSFTLTDARMTACEGEKPAWEFTTRRGRFTLEEYAHFSGTTFRMGGVPLLYLPWLVWPVLRERASGFMIPVIGYNSNRGGYLGLSYYWAISRSVDATFVGDLYTKGWYGLGAELRARPSTGTHFDGLYYTVRDPLAQTWQWKSSGTLVSDDIGPRLRGVVNWLEYSDLNFWQGFETSFNLASLRSVGSDAFLTWNPDPFSVNFRYSQEKAALGATEVILEREPTLEAVIRPIPVFSQSAFVEASGQAGLLHADRGVGQPSGTYGRFDLFPRASVPLPIAPWLSAQASGGARLTSYGKSLDPTGTILLPDSYNRLYGIAGLELTGPSFSRIFNVDWGDVTKIKHVIEPRIDYAYQSDPGNLARTPLFDEIDAVTATNTVRYALVQRLLAKTEKGSAREVASLEIGQNYYFTLPGAGTSFGPSPLVTKLGTLDAILRIVAGSGFNFDGRASRDMKANQLTAASITGNWARGDASVALSYFYSNPVTLPPPPGVDVPSSSSSQIRFYGGSPILKKLLRFDVAANYDMTNGKMLESRYLLTFQGSCYKILAEYRDIRVGTIPSRDFRIGLNLKNIGNFLDVRGSIQ